MAAVIAVAVAVAVAIVAIVVVVIAIAVVVHNDACAVHDVPCSSSLEHEGGITRLPMSFMMLLITFLRLVRRSAITWTGFIDPASQILNPWIG